MAAASGGSLRPSVTTVQFGEISFDTFSTEFGVFTPYEATGMLPQMGQVQFAIQMFIDMQDNVNLSFDKVQYLFANSHTLTTNSIKDCKLTFWQDDSRSNALSTFAFRGWIAHFGVMSGEGSNHLLMIRLQPRPGEKQFVNIQHGN